VFCIADLISVDRLFSLKDGVDAFCRNDCTALELEDEWRVLPIEHEDVDLVAEIPLAIHHMRLCRPVTLRQVKAKHLKPHRLACITLISGVSQRGARGPKPML